MIFILIHVRTWQHRNPHIKGNIYGKERDGIELMVDQRRNESVKRDIRVEFALFDPVYSFEFSHYSFSPPSESPLCYCSTGNKDGCRFWILRFTQEERAKVSRPSSLLLEFQIANRIKLHNKRKCPRGVIPVCFNWLTVNLHVLELCLLA